MFSQNYIAGVPYWWEHGDAAPPLSSSLPANADLLIVGAGYTGLSAAIAAADAGAKVVVVDAGVPGQGASSRNGGMFGAHPRVSYQQLSKNIGEQAAAGIFEEAQSAYDFTSALIKQENIDCYFEQVGRIQLAWTADDFDQQKKQVAWIKQNTGMAMELLERDALANEISTNRYYGAIRFPTHASLHPKLFHDGLLRAALERNIDVIPHCEINSVTQQDNDFECINAAGKKISAKKVLMAGNGYTRGKFNWFQRRVFPLPSFLIATEPLSNNLIQQLAPGRRMMVETRSRHSYFRVSPDGSRIIYGGRAAMRPITAERAAAILKTTMCEVWPELNDVKLSHCWSGNTGYSFTHMPNVGVHNGIHYSMGYSGSGTALAPYLGMKAAYQALGDKRGETAYSQTVFKPQWHYVGGKPYFLSIAELWYNNVVDRIESAKARK